MNPTAPSSVADHERVGQLEAGRASGSATHFAVLGTSYRLAPLAVRERLALPANRTRLVDLAYDLAGFSQVCLLVTCNRVECWGMALAPVDGFTVSRVARALSVDSSGLQLLSRARAYLHAVR